jgi:hydrogenase maturation protein HypF
LKQRLKITIKGAVQGVGFRPFVYRLANELGIKGWVINSPQGVFIDAEADEEKLQSFTLRLKTDKPKNSFIESFESIPLPTNGYEKFEIRESEESGKKTALVLPDIATCSDCLKEIFDPENRRYLYPFTNCTNCGPRFTIVRDLPYDRANTSMSEFEMCRKCREEYTNPADRRFHAEPIACPECGPHVALWNEKGITISEKHDAILASAEHIKSGKIIALKGIGGFQLIVDARNDEAIKLLRHKKRRSEKPFALMFPDVESVKRECEVSELEEKLLKSVQSPIVLLRRNQHTLSPFSEEECVSREVAPGNPYLGVMLPYSPLHYILIKELGFPVVATSGNISEEPICIDESEALERLSGIADYFLVHNRKILRHADDSILRVMAGQEMVIRRARGYAPMPVRIIASTFRSGSSDDFSSGALAPNETSAVLAVGAHLKNTVALSKGNNVFISQHIGDLENEQSIEAFKKVTNDLQSFYEIKPAAVVCDSHPDYVSSKYAKEHYSRVISVQHHYAHILSCMAEHGAEDDVLGVSWDGTGYGTDGSIWGGEFLIPKGRDFERIAYLKPLRLPGGEKAIFEIWRVGFALLYDVFGDEVFQLRNIGLVENPNTKIVKQMLGKNINSPLTSSMGRLFDGVAAIIGLRHSVSFEAQAAMELEFACDGVCSDDSYNYAIEKLSNGSHIISWNEMIKNIVADIDADIPRGFISNKFHNTLTDMILSVARIVGLRNVVLSGGCFQNKYLIERTIEKLREQNFDVYWHQKVPTNDGGISLGQVKYAQLIID